MAEVKEIEVKDFRLNKGILGSEVELKLPCMRKAYNFCIYNFTDESKYIEFQGDNKCFIYMLDTDIIKYSNKGNAPIYFYAGLKTTHVFKVTNKNFINEVKAFVKGDKRNKEDGSTVCTLFL